VRSETDEGLRLDIRHPEPYPSPTGCGGGADLRGPVPIRRLFLTARSFPTCSAATRVT
jgi:hypothetical protein